MCPTVYFVVRIVAHCWIGDTQSLEGIQSLIKLGVKRAPTISLHLLDARVGLTKAAGLGSRATKHFKYSQISDRIRVMISDAQDHIESGKAILSDVTRFSPPAPVTRAILDRDISGKQESLACLQWTASNALALARVDNDLSEAAKFWAL